MVRGNNSHWRRWEMSLKLAPRRTTNPTRSGPIRNQIIPATEVSPLKMWHSCWVYGPYLFSLPTNGRLTQASNREINQKLLTLLEQPSCLTASYGELKNRVFPWVFAHRKPIRRCHLRSHDSHAGFQQSDARASQWWRWPLNLMYFHP